MSESVPFTRRPVCIKCQSQTVRFHYFHGVEADAARPCGWRQHSAAGHIDVTCTECGYLWWMATADTP